MQNNVLIRIQDNGIGKLTCKGVIDVKSIYKEEDSFHIRREKIKNPGPQGRPGALGHFRIICRDFFQKPLLQCLFR